jgi:hypothetical protein
VETAWSISGTEGPPAWLTVVILSSVSLRIWQVIVTPHESGCGSSRREVLPTLVAMDRNSAPRWPSSMNNDRNHPSYAVRSVRSSIFSFVTNTAESEN